MLSKRRYPQGLKPGLLRGIDGTAEAVPFPNVSFPNIRALTEHL
jgi:hypothetical protein